jgi:hypothetical protein
MLSKSTVDIIGGLVEAGVRLASNILKSDNGIAKWN